MNVHEFGQVAWGQAHVVSDESQNESLWTRNADFALHLLRRRLESVDDRPQQAHEAQHLTQGLSFEVGW